MRSGKSARRSRPRPTPPSRRGRRPAGCRRVFCCGRSLATYASGALLFLPASILVLLTAHAHLRPLGSEDEPRRKYYAANDLREAVRELKLHVTAQARRGPTVALAGASVRGSSVAAALTAAPVRLAQREQLAAIEATLSSAPDLLHELKQAHGGLQHRQQLMLQDTHDSESTRRESSDGKELLRQERASAALLLDEQLSEEEVINMRLELIVQLPAHGCAASGSGPAHER